MLMILRQKQLYKHMQRCLPHQLLAISNNQILWSSGYDSRLGSATAVNCERPPVRVRARSFFCGSFSLSDVPADLVLDGRSENEFWTETTTPDDNFGELQRSSYQAAQARHTWSLGKRLFIALLTKHCYRALRRAWNGIAVKCRREDISCTKFDEDEGEDGREQRGELVEPVIECVVQISSRWLKFTSSDWAKSKERDRALLFTYRADREAQDAPNSITLRILGCRSHGP
jgi:hypothetical protein